MKKRKILALLCVASLSAGLLAGCGSDKNEESSTENSTTESKENTGNEEASEDEEEVSGFTDGDNGANVEEPAETTDETSTEGTASDAGEDLTEGTGSDAGNDSAEETGSDAGDASTEETVSDTGETSGVLLDTSEQLTGIHHAEIEVKDYGTIKVELDADTAPISVTNFVKLAQEHFYDGLTFHRIMDGFMIQGGDPEGTGRGGSDETIKGEFSSNGVKNNISHERGVISMARSSDPDSASSQFFIVQTDSTYLDGQYAAFGHVTEGMDVVDAICKDAKPTDNNGTIPAEEQPVITSVTITD